MGHFAQKGIYMCYTLSLNLNTQMGCHKTLWLHQDICVQNDSTNKFQAGILMYLKILIEILQKPAQYSSKRSCQVVVRNSIAMLKNWQFIHVRNFRLPRNFPWISGGSVWHTLGKKLKHPCYICVANFVFYGICWLKHLS